MAERIGEMLVRMGLITEESLRHALNVQRSAPGRRLGAVLVDLGLIDPNDLARVLAERMGLALARDCGLCWDGELLARMPPGFCQRYLVAPFRPPGATDQRTAYLAMADPTNLQALDEARQHVGMQLQPVVATPSEILSVLAQKYAISEPTTEASAAPAPARAKARIEFISEEEETPDRAQEVQVVDTVNDIIADAIETGASDIHFEPGPDHVQVRFRVRGQLRNVLRMPGSAKKPVISYLKVLAGMDITNRSVPQDGHIKARFAGRAIDLRLATLPSIFGEKAAIRVLDSGRSTLALQQVGFDEDTMRRLNWALNQQQGVIIVAGPTGSGKTTTLYACLKALQDVTKNTMTIEDPVELILDGVTQIEVHESVGLTFAEGLRAILRQNPDVIMVGEVRDQETCEIAIRAGLTGHLVLTTVHAQDAILSLARLADLGAQHYLLAAAVNIVVAQRLVARNCPQCREEVEPDPTLLGQLEDMLGHPVQGPFFRGRGCPTCRGRGLAGLTAVAESLSLGGELRQLVGQGAPEEELRRAALRAGFRPLMEVGLEKARSGEISLEQVFNNLPSPRIAR